MSELIDEGEGGQRDAPPSRDAARRGRASLAEQLAECADSPLPLLLLGGGRRGIRRAPLAQVRLVRREQVAEGGVEPPLYRAAAAALPGAALRLWPAPRWQLATKLARPARDGARQPDRLAHAGERAPLGRHVARHAAHVILPLKHRCVNPLLAMARDEGRRRGADIADVLWRALGVLALEGGARVAPPAGNLERHLARRRVESAVVVQLEVPRVEAAWPSRLVQRVRRALDAAPAKRLKRRAGLYPQKAARRRASLAGEVASRRRTAQLAEQQAGAREERRVVVWDDGGREGDEGLAQVWAKAGEPARPDDIVQRRVDVQEGARRGER
mmetsp:Transcript_33429/g.106706  ORF Transcript_33429/g.106706 Transcript_33429/m.106706 type:complete len:329 (+) Transcript_33429:597-1583(+)